MNFKDIFKKNLIDCFSLITGLLLVDYFAHYVYEDYNYINSYQLLIAHIVGSYIGALILALLRSWYDYKIER